MGLLLEPFCAINSSTRFKPSHKTAAFRDSWFRVRVARIAGPDHCVISGSGCPNKRVNKKLEDPTYYLINTSLSHHWLHSNGYVVISFTLPQH
jgi:hypothetical protein